MSLIFSELSLIYTLLYNGVTLKMDLQGHRMLQIRRAAIFGQATPSYTGV